MRIYEQEADRDQASVQSDLAAGDERDRAAEARDRAADERDRAAADRDCAAGRSLASEREHAARDREESARDRAAAAVDRARALRDRQQAGLDALTGALRRDRGLVDLQHEIERARRSDGRLVLAFVDVDGLKAVNDTYGHAAGDQLLRDAVTALRAGLRSYDLVIRYGGDEFVCALSRADCASAQRRFDEVTRKLAQTNPSASMSVGLTELRNADNCADLIARADAALYQGSRPATVR
jgi:diguanylate cyclase (GGDEF)-like protein